MVGGHLDSWISGTGATDNGAGSIVAMEAMRILKALGVEPRRTIRIALWSGEEQGLFGLARLCKTTLWRLQRPTCAGERAGRRTGKSAAAGAAGDDQGVGDAGRVLQTWTMGRARCGGFIRRATSRLRPSSSSGLRRWLTWAYRPSPTGTRGGRTTSPTDAVGLPGFQFIQDPMDYETRTHHSDMDTVDRLHPLDLEQAAVVEAIFLYNTSQREEMMPRKPFPHPELERAADGTAAGPLPQRCRSETLEAFLCVESRSGRIRFLDRDMFFAQNRGGVSRRICAGVLVDFSGRRFLWH